MKTMSRVRLAPSASGTLRIRKVLQNGVTERSGSSAPSRSGRRWPSTFQPVPDRSTYSVPWPCALQRSILADCTRQSRPSRQWWSRRKPPASRQSTVEAAVMPSGPIASSKRSSPSTSFLCQKRTECLKRSCPSSSMPVAAALVKLHPAVEIGKLLAALRLEAAARILHHRNTVDAEGAEIVPQLAPGDQRPHLAPEPQTQGVYVALGRAALLVAVVERKNPALLHRLFHYVDGLLLGLADHPVRCMDFGSRDTCALRLRQHRADLDKGFLRRARHTGAAEGARHARACHQRNDLVTGEHQRRQLEAFAHQISDARLAVDGNSRRLQVGNVAIDSALGDLEPLRKHARGHQPPAAHMLNDLEEPVRTPHGGCSSGELSE